MNTATALAASTLVVGLLAIGGRGVDERAAGMAAFSDIGEAPFPIERVRTKALHDAAPPQVTARGIPMTDVHEFTAANTRV